MLMYVRRAALVPFMAEGDNFFSNMDRQFVEENLRKEQVRRQVAAAAAEAAAALKVEAVAKMRAAREAEEEKRRVAEQAKKERAEKELEGKRQALLSKGPGSPKSKPKPKKQPPPATPPPAPREIKTVEDIDFKAVRADPMTVAETLVKVRFTLTMKPTSASEILFLEGVMGMIRDMFCDISGTARAWKITFSPV